MLKSLTIAATLGFAAFALPQAVLAQGDQPNLLIVGEDADVDTVPRNSRIFNRVLRAVEGEMQAEGFVVYDETAVSMAITDPARVRRPDSELITLARRIQNVPMDAIVVFQIYASAEQNTYADILDLRVRIPGRIINVNTGQAMANWEVDYDVGELPPLPVNCNRECVLEHVGDQARMIGADIGSVLATQLGHLSPAAPSGTTVINGSAATNTVIVPSGDCTGMTTAYSLTFRHFEPEQLTAIEEYLVAFQGYQHQRPVRSNASETMIWYETCSDAARLNRNLRMMAEHQGWDARIGLNRNVIEIEQIRAPVSR